MKILVAILLPILISQVVCQSGSGFGELEDEDLGRDHHRFSQNLKSRIYFLETLFVLFFLKVSLFRKQIFLFSFEPKTERNYSLISALASKKRSDQKNKHTLYY